MSDPQRAYAQRPPRLVNAQSLSQFRQHANNGVWQYLIDHSVITNEGNILIRFSVNSREDFEKKMCSRIFTDYKRKDPAFVETKAQRMQEEYRVVKQGIVLRRKSSYVFRIKYRLSRIYLMFLSRVRMFLDKQIKLVHNPYHISKWVQKQINKEIKKQLSNRERRSQ